MTEEIPFDNEWVLDIIEGRKEATVRNSPNVYGGIDVGEVVQGVTVEGHPFGNLEVERVAQIRVDEVGEFLDLVDAEYPADSEEDVIETLSDYYPDVIPTSTVVVITFDYQPTNNESV